MFLWILGDLLLAAPPSGEEGWWLSPEIGTEVPVAIDVGLRLETPHRFRIRVGLGYLPGSYLSLANNIVTALFPEYYTEDSAALVESALARSILFRSRLSWRPAPKLGLVVGGGVSYAALGGEATAAELVAGLTRLPVPNSTSEDLDIDARAQVLLAEVALEWEIQPWPEHPRLSALHIRPTLGWSFSVASTTDLEPTFDVPPGSQAALNALESGGEAYLDDLITTYVHPPFVGVQVGWRLRLAGGSGSPARPNTDDGAQP